MTKQQLSSAAKAPSLWPGALWQREIAACFQESDAEKLLQLIHAAECAIATRLRELGQSKGKRPTHGAEREAIAEALRTLRVLKRDRLGFPDWNGKA